jgi:anti-sigma regulatory factor (Ser/Thr protein kinase)
VTTKRLSATPCDSEFPMVARRFVHSALDDEGLGKATPAADLLVSEVGTFAVLGGQFEEASVEVDIDDDRIRIDITDPGSYYAEVVHDMPLDHTVRSGGIGLFLVDRIADRWGIESDGRGEGSTLWFELDTEHAVGTHPGCHG